MFFKILNVLFEAADEAQLATGSVDPVQHTLCLVQCRNMCLRQQILLLFQTEQQNLFVAMSLTWNVLFQFMYKYRGLLEFIEIMKYNRSQT